jgi:ABC-type Fe3+ transport system substrate-binding protein
MAAAPSPVNPLAGGQGAEHVAQMATDDKERQERLAAALRENLKRRKAQARAQDQSVAKGKKS